MFRVPQSSLTFVKNLSQTSSRSKSSVFVHLTNRSVVRVRGSESGAFLQGLITNNIDHFDDDKSISKNGMYSVMLNTQGRIVFDSIMHRADPDSFLLDCDLEMAPKLIKHLKMYKVRRKIDLDILENQAVFAVMLDKDEENVEKFSKDPRVEALGIRTILDSDQTLKERFQEGTLEDHRRARFRLGVPEGSKEIPRGKCFPHEFNADFMHGISFHKGCYIGQELTARVQHTGVVRKRVMPVKILGSSEDLVIDSDFLNEKGKKIGKLKAISKDCGLGLMRLAETDKAKEITINGVNASVEKPDWWPKEAPKKLVKEEE